MSDTPTRELILRDARSCAANQRYEDTSLNDIAAGVGILVRSALPPTVGPVDSAGW